MARLTKKQLKVLDKAELRRIAMSGMGLPMREAYSLDEEGLLDWIHKHPDVFVETDLTAVNATGKNGSSLFRDGIFDYCTLLQKYMQGEVKAPVWPPEEDAEAPPEEPEVVSEPEPTPDGYVDVQEVVDQIEAATGEPVAGPTSEEIEEANDPPIEVVKAAPKVKKNTKKRTNADYLANIEDRVSLIEDALIFLVNSKLYPNDRIDNLNEFKDPMVPYHD